MCLTVLRSERTPNIGERIQKIMNITMDFNCFCWERTTKFGGCIFLFFCLTKNNITVFVYVYRGERTAKFVERIFKTMNIIYVL